MPKTRKGVTKKTAKRGDTAKTKSRKSSPRPTKKMNDAGEAALLAVAMGPGSYV